MQEKFYTVEVMVTAKVLVTCWATSPEQAMVEAEQVAYVSSEDYEVSLVSVDCLTVLN